MGGSSGASKKLGVNWSMPELGLVVGKFAPLHVGHMLVISTALERMDHVIVLVYSNPDFPEMPSATRARWIRQLFPDAVVFVPENPPPNDADDWTHREFVRVWLEEHKKKLPFNGAIHAVFGSDEYIPGFAAHIGANAHLVDAARGQQPISGTQLRQAMERIRAGRSFFDSSSGVQVMYSAKSQDDIRLLTNHLPGVVRKHVFFWMKPVHRVVFLGAESTGKTTLTQAVAESFAEPCVLEYGREVWERKNGVLEPDDYTHIAEHHRELEKAAMVSAKRFLFVDTNAITTAFLGYAYEGSVPDRVMQLAREAETAYHHVFVCADDIPFHQDGWRDDHVWRSRAQHMVMYDLQTRGVPFVLVSGDLEKRVQQVRAVLERRVG